MNVEFDLKEAANADSISLAQLQQTLANVWQQEIFSFDDHPITVGKIVLAVLMLFGGLFVARRASQMIDSRRLNRFGIHESGAQAIQSVSFYGFSTFVGVYTLQLLSIPLTMFAFLGGAAAIAIGFGSQTLLNNFISGLIILGERPARVGDLVEVDGMKGRITRIGARSPRLYTVENLEVIVPNSKSMEQKLVNWTLSSTIIRRQVTVGIAYGSPVEEAIELLQGALSGCSVIHNNPKPVVLFADFGTNSLDFDVYSWIHIRESMAALKADSAVRRVIAKALAQNNMIVPRNETFTWTFRSRSQSKSRNQTPSCVPRIHEAKLRLHDCAAARNNLVPLHLTKC